MLPALFIGGAVVSGVGAGGYKALRGYRESLENKRYWQDYQRNTGVQVRYPYRAGYHYDYSRILAGANQGFQSMSYGYYAHQKEWW